MDAFLISLQDICLKLLPFFGCLTLAFLIFFLRKLSLLTRDLSKTLTKVDKTIDTLNNDLEELKQPISTIKNLAISIDKANEFGNKIVLTSFNFIKDNFDSFINWLKVIFKRFKKKEESKNEVKDEY